MGYTFQDGLEAGIGAFSASLFFVALRSGNPFSIEPIAGIVITILWGWLLYTSAKKFSFSKKFIPNIMVTVVVAYLLTRAFNLLPEGLSLLELFGSPLIIVIWMGAPLALIFEKMNIKSPLARYYIGRGR